jgi:hypothetical protein
MRSRPVVQAGNFAVGLMGPALDNLTANANAVDAATLMTVAQLLGGLYFRSGLTAGRTDTFPTVDGIIAALDNPQVDDSFGLTIRVNEAFLLTITLGAGMVAGLGTITGVAASSTRHFRFTLKSTKRTTIKIATTTNASKDLTKIPVADLKDVMPGMLATGAGLGAAPNIVLGVLEYIDATDLNRYGKVSLDVASTATADNIAVTFTPRMIVDSFGVHGN